MDECGGAATVEVDRVLATEGDHEASKLRKIEARVHACPTAVAGDRKQLRSA